jgi:hypothetical protein
MGNRKADKQVQVSRSDLQTFADERFACKMSVERNRFKRREKKAERLGCELFLCDVSKHVQICNHMMKDKCSGKTTDAARTSMTDHGLRNS